MRFMIAFSLKNDKKRGTRCVNNESLFSQAASIRTDCLRADHIAVPPPPIAVIEKHVVHSWYNLFGSNVN